MASSVLPLLCSPKKLETGCGRGTTLFHILCHLEVLSNTLGSVNHAVLYVDSVSHSTTAMRKITDTLYMFWKLYSKTHMPFAGDNSPLYPNIPSLNTKLKSSDFTLRPVVSLGMVSWERCYLVRSVRSGSENSHSSAVEKAFKILETESPAGRCRAVA